MVGDKETKDFRGIIIGWLLRWLSRIKCHSSTSSSSIRISISSSSIEGSSLLEGRRIVVLDYVLFDLFDT